MSEAKVHFFARWELGTASVVELTLVSAQGRKTPVLRLLYDATGHAQPEAKPDTLTDAL